MQKKIPMPQTSRIPVWKEFVRIVHKSIGRKLGSGKINFSIIPVDKN
jgi:hypothetical protein